MYCTVMLLHCLLYSCFCVLCCTVTLEDEQDDDNDDDDDDEEKQECLLPCTMSTNVPKTSKKKLPDFFSLSIME